jgi:formylmethanofuran dehydrogenase subunit B
MTVTPDRHWEALTTLRMLARGIEPPAGEATDILRSLAARMVASRFGVVCFGDALTGGPLGDRTAEALFQLVAELNDRGRFYAIRMRSGVSGADSVLAWQTGYPFGVNFGKGYPRSHPGETTGPDVLARGEADVCVLVGGSAAADLPEPALARLRRIPVIRLDEPGGVSPVPAAVRFTTAVYGVHTRGTAHRMDDVSIPLRVLLPTDLPTDADVLGEILKRVVP